jgi:predicted short-subunit dehydrogenase-like oxidoreductase (DUF2520 family)
LLWRRQGTFAIGDVLDGTPEGARGAVAFVGGGKAVSALAEMRAADVWMITTPDRAIASSALQLAAAGVLRPDDTVFHCSGSMASGELAVVRQCGAHVASIHPLKSFADPAAAAASFAHTHCVAEGDASALALLHAAFEAIRGRMSPIDAEFKIVYHAASVIVCNYLTALMEAGLRGYEKAGMDRATASDMMQPLVRETLDNVFSLGTSAALTGPIVRGDDSVVAAHLQALDAWDTRIAAVYRSLGVVALDVARERPATNEASLSRIDALLKS